MAYNYIWLFEQDYCENNRSSAWISCLGWQWPLLLLQCNGNISVIGNFIIYCIRYYENNKGPYSGHYLINCESIVIVLYFNGIFMFEVSLFTVQP